MKTSQLLLLSLLFFSCLGASDEPLRAEDPSSDLLPLLQKQESFLKPLIQEIYLESPLSDSTDAKTSFMEPRISKEAEFKNEESPPSLPLLKNDFEVFKGEQHPPEAFIKQQDGSAIILKAISTDLNELPAAEAPAIQPPLKPAPFKIDLKQIFAGAPTIYSVLFVMSIGSLFILLYTFLRLRGASHVSREALEGLRAKLLSNQYSEALEICSKNESLLCNMIASGIGSRRHGFPIIIEAMQAEAKRSTISFWQRLVLLNDIAIIAPMLGLLGTVLGMFYAFYDLNRSLESVSTLFDGLGISVGTTIAGLVVAILAMVFYSLAKFRLVKLLARIENEAYQFANIIDDNIHPRS